MKISRVELKNIVKECLLEILSEGVGSTTINVQSERREPPLRRRDAVTQAAQPAQVAKNNQLSNMMKKSEFSDLQSLLEDTAQNTLPRQNAADRGKMVERFNPGDDIAQAVSESTPDEIFGEETTRKWAELAFAPSLNRK